MRPEPLQVQYLTTRRPHLGPHAGLPTFIRHLGADAVMSTVRYVADGDDDFESLFPFVGHGVQTRLRHLLQRRRQHWYKLSDFVAEIATAPAFVARMFDLLHMIDGEHTAQYLPLVRRRLGIGVPVVATYHQPPSLLEPILARDVVESLDHVTVLASNQRALLETMIPPDRVSLILHGVDTEFFAPSDSVPVAAGRCLTTGAWQRDWDVLASIARALPTLEFHVVAFAAPSFANCPNVRVHRDIDDLALRALYHASQLVVLPLREAAANNALLEAMACAVPVIASDLPALREYAPPPLTCFVEHRTDAFVAAIRELTANPSRMEEMRSQSLARARALSWFHVADRYTALYKRVVSGTMSSL